MSVKRRGTKALHRLLLLMVALLTTGWGVYIFAAVIWAAGVHLLDLPLLVVFSVLFFWVNLAFWTATVGFLLALRRPLQSAGRFCATELPPEAYANLPRCAILVPVYNEDPDLVLAGVRATRASLQATGHADRFDFFILSDTTDPDIWIREERAWADAVRAADGAGRVFYRRRPRNIERKSGNVAEFCRQWGARYEHIVIFDADSVMEGRTLIEMARRMRDDPQLGILQVPPVPVNRSTFFARLQQFAADVYGDVFVRGWVFWCQQEGNYWGHNAIIRVKPFIEHCGLPKLPGAEPLGGEILSHDFVEAALMLCAGWKVALADDLGGSYEEPPATLRDFAQRDRRWCQGNLQHVRLVFTSGFHPMSRVHLGIGAMAYLSSVLWLLFLLLSFGSATVHTLLEPSAPAAVLTDEAGVEFRSIGLFLLTLALLFLPKLWGYLHLRRDRVRCDAHGGAGAALVSVGLEALISVLTAPIMMAFHASFVLESLLGRRVTWHAQRRSETRSTLREASDTNRANTIIGLAAAATLAWCAPVLFWWMLPVWLGLAASIPLTILLDSRAVGNRLRPRRLLLIPQESRRPRILVHQQRLAMRHEVGATRAAADPFFQAVVEPALNALHCEVVERSMGPARDPAGLRRLEQIFLNGGTAYLKPLDKLALLSSPAAMRRLHRAWWRQPSHADLSRGR